MVKFWLVMVVLLVLPQSAAASRVRVDFEGSISQITTAGARGAAQPAVFDLFSVGSAVKGQFGYDAETPSSGKEIIFGGSGSITTRYPALRDFSVGVDAFRASAAQGELSVTLPSAFPCPDGMFCTLDSAPGSLAASIFDLVAEPADGVTASGAFVSATARTKEILEAGRLPERVDLGTFHSVDLQLWFVGDDGSTHIASAEITSLRSAVTPEPAAACLLALGAVALGVGRRLAEGGSPSGYITRPRRGRLAR